MRLTLGCLLADELGIELRRASSGKRLTFCDGKSRLNEWLARNAFVTWHVDTQPWALESELLRTVPLPLNLEQSLAHPFRVNFPQFGA